MKLTEAEWHVLEVLWSGEFFSLKEVTEALQAFTKWNKKTVYTYLVRMEAKGLVRIFRESARPYAAAVTREACALQERGELLEKVYHGAAGEMITAFLKETKISKEEVSKLRKLLDEMEV